MAAQVSGPQETQREALSVVLGDGDLHLGFPDIDGANLLIDIFSSRPTSA
jgi:hypothetical protein